MDDQEKREAGREFGETLRQKLAANRRGFTAERFAERLVAGREGPAARRTEESGLPKEPDELRGQGHAQEGS